MIKEVLSVDTPYIACRVETACDNYYQKHDALRALGTNVLLIKEVNYITNIWVVVVVRGTLLLGTEYKHYCSKL